MSSIAPLRVAVDARCLNTEHLRGMGKYLWEMLAHADALQRMDWRLLGDRPEQPFHAPALRCGTTRAFDFKGHRYHTWEQVALPWQARLGSADVLHATGSTLPWWQPISTVVTLHDTLPWKQAKSSTRDRLYWDRLIPAALARCAAIVTISEASRRDILAQWPHLEPKLSLIRHGINDAYLDRPARHRPEVVKKEIGDFPYLLYVGGASPHKRFAWAIRVFESLADGAQRLLALGFTSQEAKDAAQRLPQRIAGRVRFLPFVAEDDMPDLYRHALATLYPTKFEGFGFPAIESQAVGTPILYSAVGSLAELDGPLSEVLPVDELDAWTAKIAEIRSTRAAAGGDVRRARTWARAFSWERSAQQHLEIYRRAASQELLTGSPIRTAQ